MQHFIGVDQIEARAKAIGVSLKRLSRMAGVDPATAWRAARGKTDPRLGTMRKLLECLERQEASVGKHLKELARNAGGRQPDFLNEGNNPK